MSLCWRSVSWAMKSTAVKCVARWLGSSTSFSTTWSATNLRIRNVSTFKCLLCHPIKGFVYKHTYDDHMNIHNQEKPYKCDQCEGHNPILANFIRSNEHKKIWIVQADGVWTHVLVVSTSRS